MLWRPFFPLWRAQQVKILYIYIYTHSKLMYLTIILSRLLSGKSGYGYTAIHNGAGQAPRLARWLPASWFARNGCENEEQSTLVGLAVDDFQTFLIFTPKIGEIWGNDPI